MSLRIWVYIKNVKVPNLKASLRSPSKWDGRGEEKRRRGCDVGSAGGPAGSLISHSAAQVVRDHNVSQCLFLSYCHG